MSYAVGIWAADPNGTKPDNVTKPGIYKPEEKYGYHKTNIQAKRAYICSLNPEFKTVSDDIIKYHFKASNSFIKTAKIVIIDN
jgi:hypothetical protein